MTKLIACGSEKLFRPWDSPSTIAPSATLKEEQRVASPAGSSSSSSSSLLDESSESSGSSSIISIVSDSNADAAYTSAIHQAAYSYSAHLMSSAFNLQTLPTQLPPPNANYLHTTLSHHLSLLGPGDASASAWIPTPIHHHHGHGHLHGGHQVMAPSMERFLASLESSPEALHPARLAALGMGPADIGELYQLAGLKPLHHGGGIGVLTSGVAASSTHPSATHSSGNKKQRPKRFRCPHCQVAFSNNGQLKGHVRSHTGKFISINN